MRFYIASPFFNEEELANVQILEGELEEAGHRFFSPRLGGSSKPFAEEKDPERRLELAAAIFKDNYEEIIMADIVLAVVDNRDPGTMWEHGYAFAKSKLLVTTTFKDFGLNLMIGCATDCHCRSAETRKKVYEYLETTFHVQGYIPPQEIEAVREVLKKMSDPLGDMF